jgi:hypothetical protein
MEHCASSGIGPSERPWATNSSRVGKELELEDVKLEDVDMLIPNKVVV